MNEENIKLHEAMTKPLDKVVRIWTVSGKHVEDEGITKEYTVKSTFVIKAKDRKYGVGVEMTKVGDKREYFTTVAQVSSLEELQENFPQLFELKGEFISFD